MKKVIFFWSMVVLTTYTATAQQSKIIVTGSRFTYPLVERWMAEYTKAHPEIAIKINPRGGVDADSANLIINGHELSPEEIRPGYRVVNIGRYILLPVASCKNSKVKVYQEKGLDERTTKKIFFDKYDPFADNEVSKKDIEKEKALLAGLTLYTREQKACAPTTFARYYGFEQADLRGKRIGGDDKHLIQAILKDTSGITYNNPGAIYDLKTRKVKEGLVVLPVDLNNNGKLEADEKIYDNLEVLTAALEQKKLDGIVYGNINLSFPQDLGANKALTEFVLWILKDGQQYIHEYAFLNLESADLNKQITILSNP
jgi:phosphate transport system substrate-binding protein